VFLGEFEHSLDAKGRIILPARFRARLEGGCVLTKGQDGCLSVYPREEWERKAAAMSEASQADLRARNFVRLFFSGAHEEVPDKQGRVTIPEHLRRYAQLEREVQVIGSGTRFEIWDRQAWESHRQSAERDYADIADVNPNLPF